MVEVVAQLYQQQDTRDQPEYGGFPRRGGTTVVADTEGNVRFVIAKPIEETAARQLAYLASRDIGDAALPWVDDGYFAGRARKDFRALHQGLAG